MSHNHVTQLCDQSEQSLVAGRGGNVKYPVFWNNRGIVQTFPTPLAKDEVSEKRLYLFVKHWIFGEIRYFRIQM